MIRKSLRAISGKWILVVLLIGLAVLSFIGFDVVSTCCSYRQENVPELEKMARSGDAVAAEKLAFHFEEIADKPSRLLWMRMAAKNGSLRAKIDLFDESQLGGQVGRDEGLAWLIEAADAGCPNAQYRLANAYGRNSYPVVDKQQRLNVLRKAAIGGQPEAIYQYAQEASKAGSISALESAAWLNLAREYVRSGSMLDGQIADALIGIERGFSGDSDSRNGIRAIKDQLRQQVQIEKGKRKAVSCAWDK